MKRYILSLIFLGFILPMMAQTTFIGFEQTQCGLIQNHGYTFENISMMCGSHGSGYKIYYNGNKVYEKCIDFNGFSVIQLWFVNTATGFLLESNSNGHTVYKTIDSGVTWKAIGGGAPTWLGFYLVNSNTGYLVTTWDSPKALYISRVSDMNSRIITDNKMVNDSNITDTIFGEPICPMDEIDFSIKNGSDTVKYKIVFNQKSLHVADYDVNKEFNVFPNPGHDIIEISNKELLTGESFIKMYNSLGCMIKVFNGIYADKLYIGDVENGVYFLEISVNDKRTFCKIVKN